MSFLCSKKPISALAFVSLVWAESLWLIFEFIARIAKELGLNHFFWTDNRSAYRCGRHVVACKSDLGDVPQAEFHRCLVWIECLHVCWSTTRVVCNLPHTQESVSKFLHLMSIFETPQYFTVKLLTYSSRGWLEYRDLLFVLRCCWTVFCTLLKIKRFLSLSGIKRIHLQNRNVREPRSGVQSLNQGPFLYSGNVVRLSI